MLFGLISPFAAALMDRLGMRRVVAGLLNAIPGMASIAMLLVLIFYVFAVMATKLFGTAHPDQCGHLVASALTLFQLMTFDGWMGEIVAPMMETHPWAWAFFVPFILVATFLVLSPFRRP